MTYFKFNMKIDGKLKGFIRGDFETTYSNEDENGFRLPTIAFASGVVENGVAVGALDNKVEITDAELTMKKNEINTNKMSKEYLQLLQPYYKNTYVNVDNPLYEYHFGLKKEKLCPNGVINFGQLDSRRLLINVNDNAKGGKVKIIYNSINKLHVKDSQARLELV